MTVQESNLAKTIEAMPSAHPAGLLYAPDVIAAIKAHEATRADKASGIEEDLHQLIRVALTNPSGLRGFIQANYPQFRFDL